MTLIEHNLAPVRNPDEREAFCVRWSALRFSKGESKMTKLALHLAIELDGAHHVIVEAWVESGDQPRTQLVTRQRVAACITHGDGMLHIEFQVRAGETTGGTRLTFVTQDSMEPAVLLYARTPLPAQAGFAPGSYDPPRATAMVSDAKTAAWRSGADLPPDSS